MTADGLFIPLKSFQKILFDLRIFRQGVANIPVTKILLEIISRKWQRLFICDSPFEVIFTQTSKFDFEGNSSDKEVIVTYQGNYCILLVYQKMSKLKVEFSEF